MTKTYFVISYDDKNHAKALGAWWDGNKKLWYAPNEKVKEKLKQFYTEFRELKELIGEDREYGGNDLYVDMIPSTSFYKNVRSMIYKGDWSVVGKYIFQRVNQRCECCGIDCKEEYYEDILSLMEYLGLSKEEFSDYMSLVDKNENELSEEELSYIECEYGGFEEMKMKKRIVEEWNTARLEAHERWSYDEESKVQKLERVIALCHRCHTVTHYGLAGIKQLHKYAEKHLGKVNGWSDEKIKEHCQEQWNLWEKRSKVEWILDVSLITKSGFDVVKKGEL